jgi:hypothetical protein
VSAPSPAPAAAGANTRRRQLRQVTSLQVEPSLLGKTGDHLMPPSVQRSNAKHYKSNTITEIKVYEGRAHLLPAQEGWKEIADYALEWALANATQPAATPADTA